jgi:hypothetical protein
MLKRKMLFVIGFLTFVNIALSQNMQIIPNIGIAKFVGDGSECWKLGYNLGINTFSHLSSNISFGGRLAYNMILPNGEEILKLASRTPMGPNNETYDFDLERTSGVLSIIEIIPSLMYSTSPKNGATILNITGGAGLYILTSNAKVEGSAYSQYGQVTIELEPDIESETNYGTQFGISVSIQKRFIIQSLFNIIFTEEENIKYFTFNVGYNINR